MEVRVEGCARSTAAWGHKGLERGSGAGDRGSNCPRVYPPVLGTILGSSRLFLGSFTFGVGRDSLPPCLHPGNVRVVREVESRISGKSDFALCSFGGNPGEDESLSSGSWSWSQRTPCPHDQVGVSAEGSPVCVEAGWEALCLPCTLPRESQQGGGRGMWGQGSDNTRFKYRSKKLHKRCQDDVDRREVLATFAACVKGRSGHQCPEPSLC